jgi:hypothetical protein
MPHRINPIKIPDLEAIRERHAERQKAHLGYGLTDHELMALVDYCSALRAALRGALDELGVPDEHYPAPVANAVTILSDALLADEQET